MKRTIVSLILFIIVLAVTIFGVYRNKDNTKENLTKLTVAEVAHSIFYAPQYVAISEGYFEDEGIDINLILTPGADAVTAAVLSGDAQIGFSGTEATIYVYNGGEKDYPMVFAALTKRDGSFLVSREKIDNFTLEDLKGKTVIPGRKGGVPYMTLEYVLKQNGLNPQKDLVLDDSIKFDLMAGAFTGGNAEYVTLFEPTASMTEDAKKGYIVASVGEAAGEVPYTAYCAKKSYISNNKDIIESFTKAIYKGEQWVKEHTALEIAEVIQGFFPDTTVGSLEKSVQKYKDIEAWKENPILQEEAFDKLQLIMTEAGELEQKAPYDKIVNNTFAEKVTK